MATDADTGILLIILAIVLGIRSFIGSVDDLRTKSLGWIAGFSLGMIILDVTLFLAIVLVAIAIWFIKNHVWENYQ